MKLELKHLAPYLPYRLSVKCMGEFIEGSDEDNPTPKIFDLIGLLKNKGSVSYHGNKELFHFEDIFPILRPLSYLTEEIEVNGEIFIPLEKIGQDFIQDGFFEDGLFGWGQPTGGDDEQDYYLIIDTDDKNELYFYIWSGEPHEEFSYCTEQIAFSYKYFNMLLEWHFDIFGLIKGGLAIDINTL